MSTNAEGANSALQLSSSCQARRYGRALYYTFITIQKVSLAPRSSKTPVRACSLNFGFSLVNSIGLRSRIYERTILLMFLGIILRVLSIYITNQFQPTFARGGEGVKSVYRGDCVNSKLQKNS